MHCRACGAEVVEQAVYCHKCGDRLDLQQQPSPLGAGAEIESASGPFTPRTETPASAPPPRGIEKFQQAAAARQAEADEPERELWQGGYSPRAMVGRWALSAVITVVLLAVVIGWPALKESKNTWIVVILAILLLWLYQLLVLARRRMSVSYRLTTQRLIHVSGILRRVTDRIQVIEIEDISVEQSLLERLVDVGTIRILSRDISQHKLPLEGIESPNAVAALMDEARRTEQIRRGVVIEQASRSE